MRIGQLEIHTRLTCPIPSLTDFVIDRFEEKLIDAAIAKRLEWLRTNNEKERMGRSRY